MEELIQEIASRREEVTRVKSAGEDGWRFVANDSHVAEEVFRCVARGCKTSKEVARGTDVSLMVALQYLNHLQSLGRVVMIRSGVYVVAPPPSMQ